MPRTDGGAIGVVSQRFRQRLAGRFRNEFANGPAFTIDRIGDGEYTSLLVRSNAPTPLTGGEAAPGDGVIASGARPISSPVAE